MIKIEHPITGDELRARSPRGDRRGAAFLAFNRSKRSVAIDLARPRGQDLARRLAEGSDVVIENFRPGVMDRLGLGPAELRASDPALIYVSISAYGSKGTSSSRPGFDPILQAESGMMALTGEVDGGPMRHPLSIIDTLTAAHATSAICAALHGRQRHGRGDFIDLCLLDTAIGALGNVGMQYLTDGRVPDRSGNRHVVGGAHRPVRDGNRAHLPRHGDRPAVPRLLRGDRPAPTWSTTSGSRHRRVAAAIGTRSRWRSRPR